MMSIVLASVKPPTASETSITSYVHELYIGLLASFFSGTARFHVEFMKSPAT